MANQEVIEAIGKWQAAGHVHPLTCGNDSNHKVLEAIEKDSKVILTCPDCDYTQEHIPECVLHLPEKPSFLKIKRRD